MSMFNSNTDNEQTWFTPPPLIESLGEFDLDPCTPIDRKFDTATRHFSINDNGLAQQWEGRVWLNPPYERSQITLWMRKMAAHSNGTALIFARTYTQFFQRHVFQEAYSIMWISGRIKFYDKNGIKAKMSGGAPSVLIAYSEYDAEMIEQCDYVEGHHTLLVPSFMIIDRPKQTWRVIVSTAIIDLGGEASLQDLYQEVYSAAPDRVKRNKHYKAKIRQVLQYHFNKIDQTWIRKEPY